MSIKWTDTTQLAILLEEKYPEKDTIDLGYRFTQLDSKSLDGFDDSSK